ncbi:uncharacterized protein VICG_01101 [Vittaforma corneae ATCC 50505]|uniref:Pop1 N-terminal domain-containing protein n=1 Tax=Vittaforma corneae (strain ATCC 50505) TaxID=993615 RepID=L2GNL8_VITCO|nr:uncharacterized protein VICG_01101 [Vittaforma corneae ATCC 50505]ELA41917.1 hypothetical protein VICG_01101 [Vittaforma corneae ATCC 50505]
MSNLENKESMHNDINTIDFIEARAKEIQHIESSINKSSKKTMLFQRLPFYKRRRNRNYDKRMSRKFTYRKKDRHFLRTHTFYSKRFFMLKLDTSEDISVPFKRRLKSNKYIYKSQDRGFVFDESFRGGCFCDKNDFVRMLELGMSVNESSLLQTVTASTSKSSKPSNMGILSTMTKAPIQQLFNHIDLSIHDRVQSISNLFDIIVTASTVFFVGVYPEHPSLHFSPLDCVFSIMKNENHDFSYLKNLKSVKVFKNNSNSLETYKIICDRSEAMPIYEKLINNSIIPVCLEEINRIAIENDQITVYDNLNSEIFKIIERSKNKEIIEKYNRTPPSKRQSYDLDFLFLSQDSEIYRNLNHPGKIIYCVFSVVKGSVHRCAQLFCGEECIGRVVRSEYKFSSGCCYGLGVLYSWKCDTEKFNFEEKFTCKNLSQKNFYEVSIKKIMLC